MNIPRTFILYTNRLHSSRGQKFYLHDRQYPLTFAPNLATGIRASIHGLHVYTGFTQTGVSRRSPAAIWQSTLGGNCEPGSPFAVALSMATKGTIFTISGPVVIEGFFRADNEWAKYIDWTRTEMVEGIAHFPGAEEEAEAEEDEEEDEEDEERSANTADFGIDDTESVT